jgi:glycine cleavage system regulatory protein
MEILGQDRPGIISQITAVLARHRVNVEELESECVSAPMSGEPMFQARARLGIPQGCDTGAVRRDLEKIASDLMVDMIFGKADRD